MKWWTFLLRITKERENHLEVAHGVLTSLADIPAETLDNVFAAGKFREYVGRAIWRSYYTKYGRFKRDQPRSEELQDHDRATGMDPVVLYREQIDQHFRRLPKLHRMFFQAPH